MKNILLILLLLISALMVRAQESYNRSVALGFIAAPSISWLNTNDANISSDGSVFGFKFGLNSDIYFTPNYAFNTGIVLNTTGGKLKYDQTSDIELGGETYSITPGEVIDYSITYIEIPLGLKMQTPDFNRFVFFGNFGFSPMFRTGAKDADKNNLSEEVNLFNMGYHIGGGFEYFISGTTGLTFSVLYNNGFMDVTKNQNGRSDFTTSRAVEFIVGLNF